MKALAGHQQVRPGVPQDQVVLPLLQVGQQDIVFLLLGDVGMHPEKGLRMGADRHVLGKVVGFLLRVRPDQRRVLFHLVQVVRDAGPKVIDLGQAPQPAVGLGVLLAHDGRPGDLHGLLQRNPLAAIQGEIGKALVGRTHPVVGLGGGPDPALRDPTPLADLVLLFLEPQPATRRQKVPGHPGRFQPEDSIALAQGVLYDLPPLALSHIHLLQV